MMNNLGKDFNLFRKDMGISGIAMHQYGNMINGYINPSIIEERQMNVASMDVFSRLLMDRIVFLGTAIDDTVSNIITAQLLFLQSNDNSSPINLYLNSPGGGIYAGYSILDTMNFISNDVNTMVTGMAASMAFILAISGKERSALKHSRLMQHQPLGGAQGQASDILITAKQIEMLRNELYQIISDKTGQPYEKVERDCDRDYWMTSIEAKDYGAIDKIIGV
ncbi:MAG: ATP-dependent Clp protease proteolytic subunit [Saccharofermentanales bacterium]